MCKKNKANLLNTTHSGPVEHCNTSPIYICGGEEITGSNAKANFEKCLINDKNAICTTALSNDAVKRSNGGTYISPTPAGMSSPVGNDCNISYWYCRNSGKIYREPDAEKQFKSDPKCKRNCGAPPQGRCVHQKFWRLPGCIDYNRCMGRIQEMQSNILETRKLIDDIFALQWCRDNIVVPLGFEKSNSTEGQKLIIAIGNISYLGTIGDTIKRRTADKGMECVFVCGSSFDEVANCSQVADVADGNNEFRGIALIGLFNAYRDDDIFSAPLQCKNLVNEFSGR